MRACAACVACMHMSICSHILAWLGQPDRMTCVALLIVLYRHCPSCHASHAEDSTTWCGMQAAADPALVQKVAAACGLEGAEDRVQAALHVLAKVQPCSGEGAGATAEVAAETASAIDVLPPELQQLLATTSYLPPLPLPASTAAPAALGEGMPYTSPLLLPAPNWRPQPAPETGDVGAWMPLTSLTPESLVMHTTTTPFGTFGAANVMAGLQAAAATDTAPTDAGPQPGESRSVRQRLA